MTTVAEALDRVARQCSVATPASWISTTTEEHKEIRDDFLLECVEDLQERLDLPAPIAKSQTLTGTGSLNSDGSETFTLASDFLRLQRDEMAVYDPLQDRPVIPVTEDGNWQHLTDVGAAGVVKYYRLAGYEGNWTMDVYNPPASGDTLTVHYISNLWMVSSGGTKGSSFTDTGDILLLPRRVIETGIVWRFRERKGLPYEDKYREHEALVARLSNDARGRRKINMGEPDMSVRWQDLVPSFIPSS